MPPGTAPYKSETRFSRVPVVLLVLSAILFQACASIPKRNPLPEELYPESQVVGISDARYWGDKPSPAFERLQSVPSDSLRKLFPSMFGREFKVLSISGGGENGAFAAGILVGWTEAGTRPEFALVTGISTGALAAPFAFLGPEYDGTLKEVYTTMSTKDIVKKRSKVKALRSDAAGDSTPLRALIEKYIDQSIMEAIAREHHTGRRLLVGTTNLDAIRPVTWDLGRIASSGRPGALNLLREVMLASAALPVAFPPVIIEVEAEGLLFDELHVDGGATRQAFLLTLGVDADVFRQKMQLTGHPKAYLIRNAKLDPKWKTTEPKLMDIAGRSIAAMIRTQGIGDLYREYLGAQRFGFDYAMTFIPEEFDAPQDEMFDPRYMGALFDLGYEMGIRGDHWHEAPPGLEED